MAATRGCLWLVAAYLRTLAALSWRIVAAVVGGMALRQVLVNVLFHPTQAAPGPHLPILLDFWFEPSFLWFVLPFAALRFGVRDRFVQLTGIATVGSTIMFLNPSRNFFFGAVLMFALGASTLFVRGWRKQAAALAVTLSFAFWSATGAGMLSRFLRAHHYVPAYGHGITGLEPMLAFRGSMLASAYLCVRLHRWLLENPQAGQPVQLAGKSQ
ncbi:MAG TPA: hypothetical protein VN678_01240 [Acidobacteriaceae bacterium]|nr:hypothetical protein [Acidobacteriaceae bacterium]